MTDPDRCEILVVGGGPAGLAAAVRAAEAGRRVALVDDNPRLGGQIWRAALGSHDSSAGHWLARLDAAGVRLLPGVQIVAAVEPGRLLGESSAGPVTFDYQRLILATGARERFLPFPGWTLPGVTGAGGLQTLVKGGLPIEGRRVVVAGSGPLLPAVAAWLRGRGAEIVCLAEQAPRGRLLRFAAGLCLGRWSKLRQAWQLRRQLRGVPLRLGCRPLAAEGDGRLQSVALTNGRKVFRLQTEYLACGFGLIPNTEPAQLLGCRLAGRGVLVDSWQQTSLPEVYAAGETVGIGGLDTALIEGQIAGLAAAGDRAAAGKLFSARAAARRFAAALERAFALGDALRRLPRADTPVCRCEDVDYGQLQGFDQWRAAKLQTRCGMGACQGRVCGGATEFLFGWPAESVRPPLLPTKLETLES